MIGLDGAKPLFYNYVKITLQKRYAIAALPIWFQSAQLLSYAHILPLEQSLCVMRILAFLVLLVAIMVKLLILQIVVAISLFLAWLKSFKIELTDKS